MNQKYSIVEAGEGIIRTAPDTYAGFTPEEAYFAAVKLHPEYRNMIREEDKPRAVATTPSSLLSEGLAMREESPRLGTQIFGGLDALGSMSPLPNAGMYRGILNLPGGIIDEGLEFIDSMRPENFMDTMGAIGQAFEGVVRQSGRARQFMHGRGPDLSPLHPTEELAKMAGTELANKVTDLEEWKENPAANAGLLGIGVPGSRIAQASRLADLLSSTTAVMQSIKAAKKLAEGIKGTITETSKAATMVLSGRPSRALSQAYESALSLDPKARAVWNEFLNKQDAVVHFHKTAETALKILDGKRAGAWKELYPTMMLKREASDIHDSLRLAARQQLREFGIEGVPEGLDPFDYDKLSGFYRAHIQDPADVAIITEWLKKIEDPAYVPAIEKTQEYGNLGPRGVKSVAGREEKFSEFVSHSVGEFDVGSFDSIRRSTYIAGRRMSPSGGGSPRAFMAGAYEKMKTQLVEDITDYGKLLGDFEEMSKLIEGFEAATGMKKGGMFDAINLHKLQVESLNNMIKLLRDNPASEISAVLVKQVESITGVPLLPAAAGALFNNWIGTGLISRNLIAGLPALAAEIVAGVPSMIVLLQAPLISPKIIGKVIIPTLGLGTKTRRTAQKILDSIYSKVPAGWDKDALTFWQAADRLNKLMIEKEAGIYDKKSSKPPGAARLDLADSTPYTSLSAGLKQ
jgi:hypothetical protein